MIDRLLSTFNSNESQPGKVLRFSLWLIAWLAVTDLLINSAFPFPKEPGTQASKLARYFEYGRSIEGKLSRMVDPHDPGRDDAIIEAGWLDPADWHDLPSTPSAKEGQDLLVSAYGMSFNIYLLEAAAQADRGIALRLIAGPAAPPGHSFRAWELDDGGREADVVVLGILASSLKRMGELSGMTWTYEHPAPFTYPSYSINEAGTLSRTDPLFSSREEFRKAFTGRGADWEQFTKQLAAHDKGFDSFVFHENALDRSAIARLLRRAWANRKDGSSDDALYDPKKGFSDDAEEIRVLKVMVKEFARKSRNRQQIPIVALFNDRGYRIHLDGTLIPMLRNEEILYISSSGFAPPDDPSRFLGDGHFTAEVNQSMGSQLAEMIRKELKRKNQTLPNLTAQ